MNNQPNLLRIRTHCGLYCADRPVIMGILNITPDSFYASSRNADIEEAMQRVRTMLNAGADIIDIGACSTRPDSETVSAHEEWLRLEPVLNAVREKFPDIILSVDTFRADLARKAAEMYNVDIINDVGGGRWDSEMFTAIAELKIAYVLMHSRDLPASMQRNCDYNDPVTEVLRYLEERLDMLHSLGVADVILDPGFGFAKDDDANFSLLDRLDEFNILGAPVLAGISRKSMITRTLGCTPSEALNGTTVLNTVALLRGAAILRVHDVAPARETIQLINRIVKQNC